MRKHRLLGSYAAMKYLVILLLFFPGLLFAGDPEFQDWVYVNAGGSPIAMSLGHAAPCVVDWDGDGLKDLLVGQYTSGKIRFYKNSGTNSAPLFTTFTYLQADGVDIALPFG
jgi:hypothetical protein